MPDFTIAKSFLYFLYVQEYDTVLKTLLRSPAHSLLEQISGKQVLRWLPVELPQVQNSRMDLLGEAANGELIHIELQSTNDAQMALRMEEYLLRVFRMHGCFAQQIVLYVGEPPASMPTELTGLNLSFRFQLIDIRTLDAEKMLASAWLSDNVLAILGVMTDRRTLCGGCFSGLPASVVKRGARLSTGLDFGRITQPGRRC